MFAVALRRQAIIAVLAVTGVAVQNAVNRSLGVEAVVACAALALVCLLPLLFAWSAHSYRIAVGLLAALLTLASVRAVFGGSPDLLPAAVASWLALALTRRPATA